MLHRTNGSSSTVQTDGGRYDVNLDNMNRQSIYWKEESSKVRRCTWFYKEENQFVPYEVEISEKLEVISNCVISNFFYYTSAYFISN